MASTVLKAIFNAKEDVSEALDNIYSSTKNTQSGINRLESEMRDLTNLTNISESKLDDLKNSLQTMKGATESGEQGIQEVARAMRDLQRGAITSDEATEQLERGMLKIANSSQIAEESVDTMADEVNQLAASGAMSSGWANRFTEAINDVGKSSLTTKQTLEQLDRALSEAGNEATTSSFQFGQYGAALQAMNTSAFSAILSQKALGEAAERAGDKINDAGDDANNTSADLSALNAIASTTAFTFGSLSVNIGPFNLALRNILTQLPAILAGMSTLLALVASLAGAFLVFGGVLGALVGGGALAFFEEFSSQFEDSAEAVEALMGALRDLFTEAMEPLMTDANMDLFIDAINGAARVVNRFAQFAAQMRDDVLALVNDIDADMEGMFEAMHDTFVILMPILEGIIEFFINDFPDIMVAFAQLTDSIGGDVMKIINSVGGLISALMDFVETIMPVLAVAIQVIVGTLTLLFKIFNTLPDVVSQGIVIFTILTFAAFKLITALAGLATWLGSVTTAMTAHAAAGTFLGGVYTSLAGAASAYTAAEVGLLGAIKMATAGIWSEIVAVKANTMAKLSNNLATQTLVTMSQNLFKALRLSTLWMYIQEKASWLLAAAKSALSTVILGTISTLFGEAAAASVASAATSAYAAAAWVAAAATTALAAAAATLSLPVLAIVAAIGLLIAAVLWLVEIFTGIDIFGGLIDGIMAAVDWVKELISYLGFIPGVSGPDGKKMKNGVANTDDIQTESDVNLSFEDNLEQNMDVTADPEEKERMKRVVKDAMQEANSLQRRRQGH